MFCNLAGVSTHSIDLAGLKKGSALVLLVSGIANLSSKWWTP